MNIYEQMHSGQIYNPGEENLAKEQMLCLEKLYDYKNVLHF